MKELSFVSFSRVFQLFDSSQDNGKMNVRTLCNEVLFLFGRNLSVSNPMIRSYRHLELLGQFHESDLVCNTLDFMMT